MLIIAYLAPLPPSSSVQKNQEPKLQALVLTLFDCCIDRYHLLQKQQMVDQLSPFSEQEFLITLLLTVTMVLAGIGACIFVVNCSIWTSMQKLLKEGDYTMEAKRKNRKMGAFSVVYWLILTAIYLAWSFSTNTWDKTWIVYVVGGVIYAALCVVWELVMNREKQNARSLRSFS